MGLTHRKLDDKIMLYKPRINKFYTRLYYHLIK